MLHIFEKVNGDSVLITGENASHIVKSLRMTAGERLTVCDGNTEYLCEITHTDINSVIARVISSCASVGEPDVEVTLFQCVPKNDKLELVIQKSVELGVSKIVPVLSERCVSRPDKKRADAKNARYAKIAKSACEQSRRGRVVTVESMISFEQALAQIPEYDAALFFYEGGGQPLKSAVAPDMKKLCLIIGSEGGFSELEANKAVGMGACAVTLGKRILRTETAGLAALTAVMLLTGNLE